MASPIFLTFAITGVQKQSEAALLHARVDGVVRPYGEKTIVRVARMHSYYLISKQL